MTFASTPTDGSDLGPGEVRLVPLGGLGEIGMNCLAIEQRDGIVVVDCGTSFPDDDVGIDVYHPDFHWLAERRERLVGVFLTHGHEDHIGGLPYLLDHLPVPVWGPPHALAMVRRRLDEHGFGKSEVDLRAAIPGRDYEVGPFVIEPVRVTHSIVEASSLRIQSTAGVVFHTGDFNLDDDPPDGEPTDEGRLREIGDAGVALMLSDSTNIDTPQRQGSEREVGRALADLVTSASERVVIAMFASNIQRLKLIGELAQEAGRKVCLLGRSLNAQVEVAHAIGRLNWPSDLRIAPEAAQDHPRGELLVLAGGTQAERNSSMTRLARGTHHLLRLEPGDVVAFSSRIIPGNERAVHEMYCDLLRQGIAVRHRRTHPEIHTSGHGGRSEQRRMLEMIRPQRFMPVHGTLHHLMRHGDLGRELGVDDVVIVENGTPVILGPGRLRTEPAVRSGRLPVALGGEPLTRDELHRRCDLARNGVVSVSVVVDGRNRLDGPPSVLTRGVPAIDDEPRGLASLEAAVTERFQRRPPRGDGDQVAEEIRRVVRRHVLHLNGSRPVIEVHVHKG